jgi:hypothetical protein
MIRRIGEQIRYFLFTARVERVVRPDLGGGSSAGLIAGMSTATRHNPTLRHDLNSLGLRSSFHSILHVSRFS